MNKLSPEQIQGNWSVLMSKIDTHISEPIIGNELNPN